MTPDQVENLRVKLEKRGFDTRVQEPNGIFVRPTLFVLNYRPEPEKPWASFGLYIDKPDQLNQSRCWIAPKGITMKQIDGKGPTPHPEYHERSYKEREFSPYSVNLSEYKPTPEDIIWVVKELYNHIIFPD